MSDDDMYEVPLQDQRVFGAGIKRKRVNFVAATAPSNNQHCPTKSTPHAISSRYLQIVLPGDQDVGTSTERPQDAPLSSPLDQPLGGPVPLQTCDICNLPLSLGSSDLSDSAAADLDVAYVASNGSRVTKARPHEASLAHQVCLNHSHPPSHLDRTRKGLAYLSSYGWDPDARTGLGIAGQGIQFPIKTKIKNDKMGIGLRLPPEAERIRSPRAEKLDAGRIRKQQEKDKRHTERLRELFYRDDDVERYLAG